MNEILPVWSALGLVACGAVVAAALNGIVDSFNRWNRSAPAVKLADDGRMVSVRCLVCDAYTWMDEDKPRHSVIGMQEIVVAYGVAHQKRAGHPVVFESVDQ